MCSIVFMPSILTGDQGLWAASPTAAAPLPAAGSAAAAAAAALGGLTTQVGSFDF